jgi:hypothetical protein
MTCFLKVVKEIGPQINTLGFSMAFFTVHGWEYADGRTGLSPVRVESVWRQMIDVYRGGILADRCVPPLELAAASSCGSLMRE